MIINKEEKHIMSEGLYLPSVYNDIILSNKIDEWHVCLQFVAINNQLHRHLTLVQAE